MSTENINGNDAKNEEFRISDLVTEHETMDRIMDCAFMTSTDFCSRVSALFSGIYADFQGCNFDFLPGSNVPVINLFFNHSGEAKNDLPFACSKEDQTSTANNSTLRATRSYSNRLINGDRYYLTKEGQSIDEFIIDQNQLFVTKDNVKKPNWAKLVSEVADGNYPVPQQYTQVKFLDPAKLAEAIYGRIANDTEWVYGVRVIRSIPTFSMFGNQASANYMLSIERVSKNEVDKLAKQFGLNTNSGLTIIR